MREVEVVLVSVGLEVLVLVGLAGGGLKETDGVPHTPRSTELLGAT